MKKSIPLKEIVGFLPYELTVIRNSWVKESESKKVILNGKILDLFVLGKYKEFKPVVRPLKDLAKEITHNGETFVPIVEIAKIADSVKKVIRMNHKQTITGFDYLNGSGEIMRFCYHHITKHFQITYVNEEEFRNECVLNQLEMFNKMHELKFDIYDWIKDGLAIDINTL